MKKIAIILLCLLVSLMLVACDIKITVGGQEVLGGFSTEPPVIAPTIAPEELPMPTEPVEDTMPMPSEPDEETEPPETEPVASEPADSDPEDQQPAGCDHQYTDATCTAPKTCTLCGATSGDPLEHNYEGGDCSTPGTCTHCGQTSPNGGEHSFYGGICTKCGAKNERFDDIYNALKRIERYFKYFKINHDLIESQEKLFDMTKDPDNYAKVHKEVLEIHDWLQDVVKFTEDFKELNTLTKECKELILEMPIVPSSATNSDFRRYISKGELYALNASRLSVIYNIYCKDYGLPGV